MPLRNKNDSVPKGWVFRDSVMDWENDKIFESFDAAVKRIAEVRRANPRFNLPTDHATIANELERFTEARLRSMPGWDQWLLPGDTPVFTRRLRLPRAEGGVAVGDWGKNAFAGVKLWMDWFAGEDPVQPELAEKRASICATCPLNQPATGLNALSEIAGKELAQILGSLRHKNLKTSKDDKLQVCTACGCATSAKVWVPLGVALKHLRPEAREKLDPGCWLLLPNG